MVPLLIGALALAAWLALAPPGGPAGRYRQLAGSRTRLAPPAGPGTGADPGRGPLIPRLHRQRPVAAVPMGLLVQQMAALLKGGRTPSRLWDELWLLYGGKPPPEHSRSEVPRHSAALAPASLATLAAARAAARGGAPVGAAIRNAATGQLAGLRPGSGRRRAARELAPWIDLAACFDVAEASGCPLAGVLTRFAAQLEAEDDAEAARQSALAGPRATVRLLSWLPVLGLILGALLGVDPVMVLLREPAGLAAFAAGVVLTAAGRIWAAKLVRSAAGQAP